MSLSHDNSASQKRMRRNSDSCTNAVMSESEKMFVEGELRKPDATKKEEISSDILLAKLNEYHTIWQNKYHTYLSLTSDSETEVTAGNRNGSAHILRCLKVWYELPSDVLFVAMFFIDRFIHKITVKPKHMSCLSIAAFHLALRQLRLTPISTEELAKISQSGCTSRDVERMSNIILTKICLNSEDEPITALNCLRIYFELFRNWARQISDELYQFFEKMIKLEELITQMEILLCDVRTSMYPPSSLTYALICIHLNIHMIKIYGNSNPVLCLADEYAIFLRQFLGVSDEIAYSSFNIVFQILVHYNGHNKMPHKQQLIWKLSTRTLRVLRPIDKFKSYLPTIEEHTNIDGQCSRPRMESTSSEDDWPVSSIIPVYE